MISEIDIWNYYIGENVILTDIDGKHWCGCIMRMEGSNDSENGKYSIDLKEEGENRSVVVGFYEDETKSIEVID